MFYSDKIIWDNSEVLLGKSTAWTHQEQEKKIIKKQTSFILMTCAIWNDLYGGLGIEELIDQDVLHLTMSSISVLQF